ncbi:MAG: hypothetical protein GYA21_17415 [Myxococcales bacterium]|nr:hypothetical protein [Myxococcales bacterium]
MARLGWSWLAIALVISACKGGTETGKAPVSGEIVAKVGSSVITLEDFEAALNEQNALIRSRYTSVDQKKKLLETLVEREVMVQEAKRLGLDKDPEMRRGFDKILARFVINREFNEKKVKEITVSDADIEAYYQQNLDRYHAPEKVMIHDMLFPVPAGSAERKKVRAQAEEAHKKLKANPQDRKLFFDLMRQTGGEEATRTLASATFQTRAEMEKERGATVAAAAFALQQANDFSPIVEDDKGFHILRLAGRQAALDLPLEKVKGQIRTTLFAKARGDAYQAFVEGIKSKAGVQVFDEVLQKAKVDLSNTGPSPAPGNLNLPPLQPPVPVKPIDPAAPAAPPAAPPKP